MNNSLYIMEFKQADINVIAQGLHIIRTRKPRFKIVNDALDSLILQSNLVRKDPRYHQVYDSKITGPSGLISLESVFFKLN